MIAIFFACMITMSTGLTSPPAGISFLDCQSISTYAVLSGSTNVEIPLLDLNLTTTPAANFTEITVTPPGTMMVGAELRENMSMIDYTLVLTDPGMMLVGGAVIVVDVSVVATADDGSNDTCDFNITLMLISPNPSPTQNPDTTTSQISSTSTSTAPIFSTAPISSTTTAPISSASTAPTSSTSTVPIPSPSPSPSATPAERTNTTVLMDCPEEPLPPVFPEIPEGQTTILVPLEDLNVTLSNVDQILTSIISQLMPEAINLTSSSAGFFLEIAVAALEQVDSILAANATIETIDAMGNMGVCRFSVLVIVGPRIRGCPVAPLPTLVVEIAGSDAILRVPLSGINLNITSNSMLDSIQFDISPSMNLDSLDVTMDSSNDLMLEVATSAVSEGTTVQLSVTIVASTTAGGVGRCSFTVGVAFVEEGLCDDADSIPLLPATRRLQIIRLTVDSDSVDEETIKQGLTAVLNSYCPSMPQTTCGICAMTTICNVFLEICRNFTSENIFIFEISANTGSNRRRQMGGTDIMAAAEMPSGTPRTAKFPLVPASAFQTAVESEEATFTASTGLRVTNVERGNVPLERETFELIAAITLPIVVVAAVITLVVGIILVIVLAKVYKRKRKDETKDKKKKKKEKKEKKKNKVNPQ